MSKINDLIKKLCPNGVEYKNIKDLCLENFWVMPSTPKYQTEGIPYITSKNIRNGIVMFNDVKYITEDDYKSISNNRPIKENDFLVSMIGTIGEVGIVKSDDLPFYGQNMYLLRLNTELVSIKFFYHYFTSDKVRNILLGEKNNGNQGYLKTKNIEMLKIPCPPLEIQEEIVRILDKFGELEAELEEELEAELEARKSQYEFWRGQMFKRKGNTKISDMFTRVKGTAITAGKMKEIEDTNGKIRIFAGGQTAVNANLEDIPKANIIDYPCVIVQSRGLIDFVYYDKPFTFKNEMWAYSCDNQVTVKYLYYYLKNNVNYFREIGTQMGSMPQISLPVTEKFEIYLPTLEEQKKVVDILDKFEKLISDISIGLPLEIELRKKQYEYYRNKLLSFEVL